MYTGKEAPPRRCPRCGKVLDPHTLLHTCKPKRPQKLEDKP